MVCAAAAAADDATGGVRPRAQRVGAAGVFLRLAALHRLLLHICRLAAHVRHPGLQDAQHVSLR